MYPQLVFGMLLALVVGLCFAIPNLVAFTIRESLRQLAYSQYDQAEGDDGYSAELIATYLYTEMVRPLGGGIPHINAGAKARAIVSSIKASEQYRRLNWFADKLSRLPGNIIIVK